MARSGRIPLLHVVDAVQNIYKQYIMVMGSICHANENCKDPKPIDSLYSYIFLGNYSYYDYQHSRALPHNDNVKNKKKRKHGAHVQVLSQDIQGEIIARLPATSIIRFRSVCRDWYAMAYHPFTARAMLAHTNKVYLAVHRGCDGHDKVHLIERNPANILFRLKNLPRNTRIVGSSNGIVCFMDNNVGGAIYLYNPLLDQGYLELPELPNVPRIRLKGTKYGFCFDHERSEFKVVRFVAHIKLGLFRPLLVDICALPMEGNSIGTPRPWKTIKVELNAEDKYIGDGGPLILVNGKLHCLAYSYLSKSMIMSFDIASEEIFFIDTFAFGGANNHILSIGELGGNLFAITIPTFPVFRADVFELWVMKGHQDPKYWTKQLYLDQQLPISQQLTMLVPYVWFSEEDESLLLCDSFHTYMVQHTSTFVSIADS